MEDHIAAHAYSCNHRSQLLRDKVCGCFYCLQVFDPAEIAEWIPDIGGTAVCPYCGIDAVIGESSGFPVTRSFLEKMRAYWF